MSTKSEYRLHTGWRKHQITKGDEVVWTCPRIGREELRKAQAKLRDFRTGEAVAKLGEAMRSRS